MFLSEILLQFLDRELFQTLGRRMLTRLGLGGVDKSKGLPLLAEEALVHAKSECGDCYIIHFYVAARDDVSNCQVPYPIWLALEKGWRGTLTHRGGMFYSFETQEMLYCEEGVYNPEIPQ